MGDHRGQSGLDRLLLFVFVVLALVFLAPIALELAGVDVRSGAGAQSAPSDHDLTVLAARGEAVASDGSSVGVVRLLVVPNHDRAPVDLGESTAIWVDGGERHLGPAGGSAGDLDGTYAAAARDSGAPVLQTPTDVGVLRFDIGSDDLPDVPEFGRRLEAGETASVTLVTPRGETLTRTLSVPAEIPDGRDEVWL